MKFELSRISVTFLISLFAAANCAYAQHSWEEIIKNENGVVIEQDQHVEINVNAVGELEIVANIREETQHFGENTNLYSEQSIGFSSTFTEISDLIGHTLVPTGKNRYKKIEVKDFITTDSRSSGIFYDDQKKISYVFPALSNGSKTYISYTKKYKEPRLWGYFMFSSFFPVEKSTYSVKVSENVKLNHYLYGIDNDQLNFSKEKRGKYDIYKWSASHLEKLQVSKGANSVLHSAPHLIIYVEAYEYNGKTYNVLGDVSDLHAWYQNFLMDIEDEESEEMKSMVESIIEGKSTELEKVEAIYDWVQKNIKYIAIEDGLGGFKPRSSSLVFRRRYGDCKDMSNLLHNMLNISNIPSSLTWIGTMSIPYSHKEVPTPMADNHMICTYKSNDQYYFMDATDQYNKLGIPSSHIQGREALINKGKNDFELVDVPVVPLEKNVTIDSVYFEISGEVIFGKGRTIYGGYNRIPVTNNLENLDEDDKKTFLDMILKKGNNKFTLDAVTTHHLLQKDKELQIDYDFSIRDYVITTADEIFINPHFSKELEEEQIDMSTNKNPILYAYKQLSANSYSIKIPNGFGLSYLPANVNYEEEDFGFALEYQLKGDVIHINQKVKMNTLQLRTDQFDSWNRMIKSIFAAYKESIVLAKN
jgi:hypothetical protein